MTDGSNRYTIYIYIAYLWYFFKYQFPCFLSTFFTVFWDRYFIILSGRGAALQECDPVYHSLVRMDSGMNTDLLLRRGAAPDGRDKI